MPEKNLSELYTATLKQMDNLTERQRTILEAALNLFAEQGFEATTSAQIAQRAGVAVGSVYQRFPNKKALLMAVLTPLNKTIFSQAADDFISHALGREYATVGAFMQALVSDRMNFIQQNQTELKVMMGQLLTDSELKEQIKETYRKRLLVTVAPTLNQFKSTGVMVDLPNDVIIQFILGPLASYFGKIILGVAVRPIEEEINNTVKLLTAALVPTGAK
ncbi:TetR/AcrR family transcriptional regulator [Lactiplantibacillus carotarum]|uniref:TetR/AcrR family transcriptional regulator n=1 Tax=Lactiplantibacillus carotarum TaxID=2993456 RepID=UPI00298F29D2|nr:helix-turn-helix domain-containing protein [Lactiplantibacillus carotarum]